MEVGLHVKGLQFFPILTNSISLTVYNKKFHKQSTQWKQSCSIRTDRRHDEASGRFPQLFERD